MSQQLVDLDALLVQIREPKSRAYFDDALRAYRAGAHRSAIASVWVAVAFDLIAKYRELAAQGDAEAQTFVQAWDEAVTNQNTLGLLQLERDLPKHAHKKLAILDQYGLRAVERLVQDRHTCAHPAFVGQDDLFEPSKELARLHLVSAVEVVLSQMPVQGRSLFEAFGRDLVSPGFPSSRMAVTDFVDRKYLQRLRPPAQRQFGVVLAKSAIRGTPEAWNTASEKVLWSLEALRNRTQEAWQPTQALLIRLINDDDPASRQRSVAVLSAFPELAEHLNETTRAVFSNLAATAAERDDWFAFRLAAVPEFAPVLIESLENLADDKAAYVLSTAALPHFVPDAVERFGRAASFRSAENRAEQFLVSVAHLLSPEHWDLICCATVRNNQIYNAAGIPQLLLRALKASPSRPTDQAIRTLYLQLPDWLREHFEDIWAHLQTRGWTRPEASEEQDTTS